MAGAKRRGGDEGASAVEFALVVPVLVLLLVGTVQFGHVFFQWLEITHAAREGARWAALGNPLADVQAKAKAAAPGIDWSAANGTVSRTFPEGSSEPGKPVKVTVTYRTPLFAPLMQTVFRTGSGTAFTLTSSAVQRIE